MALQCCKSSESTLYVSFENDTIPTAYCEFTCSLLLDCYSILIIITSVD